MLRMQDRGLAALAIFREWLLGGDSDHEFGGESATPCRVLVYSCARQTRAGRYCSKYSSLVFLADAALITDRGNSPRITRKIRLRCFAPYCDRAGYMAANFFGPCSIALLGTRPAFGCGTQSCGWSSLRRVGKNFDTQTRPRGTRRSKVARRAARRPAWSKATAAMPSRLEVSSVAGVSTRAGQTAVLGGELEVARKRV